MVPGWKVKRELLRLGAQISGLPRRFMEKFARVHYERTRWDKITVTEGPALPGEKYAIFLIYQPGPLPGSILETCRYLVANGYQTVLVSNGTLREEARSELGALCRYVLERPNFGYDFGGYRDGVHFLQQQGLSPAHLVLLNDSIWFPMQATSDVLARIEALPADITGLLLNLRRNGKMRKLHAMFRADKRPFEFLESYLIHLRRSTWESAPFRDYWDTYKQSSSKAFTVKRGELGFSKAMRRAGFSFGAVLRRDDFIAAIREKGEPFLDKTLRYAAYSDEAFLKGAMDLAKSHGDETLCERKRAHVIKVALRRRVNASFCWATEEIFGTHFIKKHNGVLFQRSREKYLEAVDAGDLQVDAPAALDEIRQRVRRDRGR
ncbi:rhamnan synthesis protein F [Rhodobacter viridis]|uniref:Rhamnan synthesis protein F n=2 Tax=Rhodobacter viridis TaxID=1054202 RepID=A0A318U7Z5_9RHOB|nr:rhamnan synthesis protein F [Rhodobacter viridis]